LELDLALKIFNDITDYNQSIDWVGFKLMMDLYDIENVKDFIEYITVIKETINNFDKIYDNKINTPEVKQVQAIIDSMKYKGKK